MDSGGVGIDGGTLLGSPPPGLPLPLARSGGSGGREVRRSRAAQTAKRAKPHDLQNLVSSGYLERLGFDYQPASAATMYRHPSSLGLTR